MVKVDGFSDEWVPPYDHSNSISAENEPIKYQIGLSKNTPNLNQSTLSMKLRNIIQIAFNKISQIFLNIFSLGKHQAKLNQQAFDQAVKEDDRQEMERLSKKSSVRVSEEHLFYLYDQNKWGFESLCHKLFYTDISLTNFKSRLIASFEKEPTSQRLTRLLNRSWTLGNKAQMIKIREVFAEDNFKKLTKEDFELFLSQIENAYNYQNKEFIQNFFKEFIEKRKYKFIEVALNHSRIPYLKEYLIESMLLTPGLDRSEILEILKSVNTEYFQRNVDSILLSKGFSQLKTAEQKQIFLFLRNKKILPPIQELYYTAIYNSNKAAEETFNKFFPYEEYKQLTIRYYVILDKFDRYNNNRSQDSKSRFREFLMSYIAPIISRAPKALKRLKELDDLTTDRFIAAVQTPELLKLRLQGM